MVTMRSRNRPSSVTAELSAHPDRDPVVTTGGAGGRARRLLVAGVLALLLAASVAVVVQGFGGGPSVDTEEAGGSGAAASGGPAPPPGEAEPAGLAQAALEAAEAEAAGSTDLAAAVLDRDTGELAVGARGDEPFFTASLSKVVVAVDMLDRMRRDGLAVTQADLDLLERALGPSDDSAMNTLWVRFDGAGAPARVSPRLGLTETTAPDDPTQWGEMTVSAADLMRLFEHVLDRMPAADRNLIIGAMADAPAVARDGFDQAFGLLGPAVDGAEGPGAAAKQGWMCCFSGEYYLHSAGVVGADQRFVVALLTRIPRDDGWDAARAEVTSVATATVRALG